MRPCGREKRGSVWQINGRECRKREAVGRSRRVGAKKRTPSLKKEKGDRGGLQGIAFGGVPGGLFMQERGGGVEQEEGLWALRKKGGRRGLLDGCGGGVSGRCGRVGRWLVGFCNKKRRRSRSRGHLTAAIWGDEGRGGWQIPCLSFPRGRLRGLPWESLKHEHSAHKCAGR